MAYCECELFHVHIYYQLSCRLSQLKLVLTTAFVISELVSDAYWHSQ
jgi:hypothetical protein